MTRKMVQFCHPNSPAQRAAFAAALAKDDRLIRRINHSDLVQAMTYDQLTNREFAYFYVRGSGRHEAITEVVGVSPHEAYSDDDVNPRTGKPFGCTFWRLNSGLDDKEPLERHVAALLLWLNRFPGAVKRLSDDYELVIQCVGYFPGRGHGAHFDRETIRILGRLGIAVDLDLYFVDDHGHDAEMR